MNLEKLRDRFGGALITISDTEYEEDGRIAEAYQPVSLERLIELKKRYDPDNVSHNNRNMVPRAE